MEQKYRSKDFKEEDFADRDGPFEEEHIQDTLDEFYNLDAYNHVEDTEQVLINCWNNDGPTKKTTLATVASLTSQGVAAASSTKAASTSTITQAPSATTSTKRSDNDKKDYNKEEVSDSSYDLYVLPSVLLLVYLSRDTIESFEEHHFS
ncbi:hypothetical protein K504DRAFT_494125 [Pleomassaria siparia CBS 279.74]|uniref:Uncharacterized protein n=1 Tax=Pleomassaria siparia CBS 279.74 TaxID=1314801 RepID=A0A6G1JY56_9PLEO|nr:hypothetical protein K504DRAFT_494125 [Pleomassaria siparia CBS 279.74]